MEQLVDAGLTKHIGLSNFNSQQIDDVVSIARIKPAVLQIESHPYLPQDKLIAHAAKHVCMAMVDCHHESHVPRGLCAQPTHRSDHLTVLV